jgi:hypothetical protein
MSIRVRARRIAKLVRLLLGTHFDGETISEVGRLRQVLQSEGLDLATLIEQKHYSKDDAEQIFARGIKKGRAEESSKPPPPPEFYDADGYPLERDRVVLSARYRAPTR